MKNPYPPPPPNRFGGMGIVRLIQPPFLSLIFYAKTYSCRIFFIVDKYDDCEQLPLVFRNCQIIIFAYNVQIPSKYLI